MSTSSSRSRPPGARSAMPFMSCPDSRLHGKVGFHERGHRPVPLHEGGSDQHTSIAAGRTAVPRTLGEGRVTERTAREGAAMVTMRVERRLAAILATDVVGYSDFMERDKDRTLAPLKVHRKEFIVLLGLI